VRYNAVQEGVNGVWAGGYVLRTDTLSKVIHDRVKRAPEATHSEVYDLCAFLLSL
jgi:hypothetical protein